MFIKNLSLIQFRSYQNLDLNLNKGINVFLGDNGEGKTNIIESIIYLSLLSSHRVATDLPLIKLDNKNAYIRAKIEDDQREHLIELEINPNKANRAKINQQPVRSQREILGLVQTTSFSPEDLDLVRGDPSTRRRYIDHLLIQESPRLSGVITDYERALKQRNSLLKSRAPISSLQPWDKHLIEFASELIASRIKLLNTLAPYLLKAYKNISNKKDFTVFYKSNLENLTEDKESNKLILSEKLELVREQERDRGITLIGPHRDDLNLLLGDTPVKGYASHGESWSVALALKLASYLLLKDQGSNPILILDDVFSELDLDRREELVELSKSSEQTLITVAVAEDLPKKLEIQNTYQVKNSIVKEVSL